MTQTRASVKPSETDYTNWRPSQRVQRVVLGFLFRRLAVLDIQGLENVPRSGGVLLAVNHLHIIDTFLGGIVLPRRVIPFDNAKWRKPPTGWILALFGGAIYRGKADSRAFREALMVLRAGGMVGIAPEGTRSRTGGLIQGHPGIIRFAMDAPAPILPMVMYGQEQATAYWKALKRVPIHVRIGTPIAIAPSGNGPNRDEYATPSRGSCWRSPVCCRQSTEASMARSIRPSAS